MPRCTLILLAFFGLGSWQLLQAQDELLKTDGQRLSVWVTEVGNTYIRFVPATGDQQQEIDLPREEVSKILYASGEEDWFNPMKPAQSAAPNPPIAVAAPAITTFPEENDLVILLNGQRFRAVVEEISEQTVSVVTRGQVEQVPRASIQEIQYEDGSLQPFNPPIAQIAATNEPAAPPTAEEPTVKKALSSARSSFKKQKQRSRNDSRWHPYFQGGISLNTGWGVGQQEVERELAQKIGDASPDTSSSRILPGIGGYLGAGLRYEINPSVSVFGGGQVILKGYTNEQFFGYASGDTGTVSRWEESWQQQQRLLHLDIPIGVEAQVHDWLLVQAGGVLGFTLWGRDSVEQTRTPFDSEGSEVLALTTGESAQESIPGLGVSPALFLGVAVPILPSLQAHLRLQTHFSSGQEAAFTQTLLQAGMRWEW